MNLWRLAALVLLAITLACSYALIVTTERLAGCMKANRLLSEAFTKSDAQVETLVDLRDGTVFVRVNGEHIHAFPNACPKGVRL
jgi:hypothetical protein